VHFLHKKDGQKGTFSLPIQMSLMLTLVLTISLLWTKWLPNLFSTTGFEPHGHCYLWLPSLVTLHAGSDTLIGLAYVAISTTLLYFVVKTRHDIPFQWVFVAFGIFIIACGATHFFAVWTLWYATYWLSGAVKLITAIASVATAVALPPMIPKVKALLASAKVSEERKHQLELAHHELELLYAKREDALHQSEQRYGHLAEAMPLLVWTARPDGAVDYFNQRWFDYTGMTYEQTQAWNWQQVVHPDDLVQTHATFSGMERCGS